MMNAPEAFSPEALEAHFKREKAEGGPRIVKEWLTTFPGFRVAIVHFGGEPCLSIVPVPRSEDAYATVIPRSHMAEYLLPNGDPSPEGLMQCASWCRTMGKEVCGQNVHAIARILVETWHDFYNPPVDWLEIEPPEGAILTISDGNRIIQVNR